MYPTRLLPRWLRRTRRATPPIDPPEFASRSAPRPPTAHNLPHRMPIRPPHRQPPLAPRDNHKIVGLALDAGHVQQVDEVVSANAHEAVRIEQLPHALQRAALDVGPLIPGQPDRHVVALCL